MAMIKPIVLVLAVVLQLVHAHYMVGNNNTNLDSLYSFNADATSDFLDVRSDKTVYHSGAGDNPVRIIPAVHNAVSGLAYGVLYDDGAGAEPNLVKIHLLTGEIYETVGELDQLITSLVIDCNGNAWAADNGGAADATTVYAVNLTTAETTSLGVVDGGVLTSGFCLSVVPELNGNTLYGVGANGGSGVVLYKATTGADNTLQSGWSVEATAATGSVVPVFACQGSNDGRDAIFFAQGQTVYEAFAASGGSRSGTIVASTVTPDTVMSMTYTSRNSACVPDIPCPNDCSNHGTCHGPTGQCLCESPWVGDDCSVNDGSELPGGNGDIIITVVIAVAASVVVSVGVFFLVSGKAGASAAAATKA